MLGHQLLVLPPFEQFWEAAEVLFQWLEGDAVEEPVEAISAKEKEDRTWSPPPWGWASLEVVRFAAANHLLGQQALEWLASARRRRSASHRSASGRSPGPRDRRVREPGPVGSRPSRRSDPPTLAAI